MAKQLKATTTQDKPKQKVIEMVRADGKKITIKSSH